MTLELIIVAAIAALIGYMWGVRAGRRAEAREQGPRAQPRPIRRAAPPPHMASEPHSHSEGASDWGPVLDALQAGQKINAIKIHRQMTGAGLKESKDFVEALARQRGIR